MRLMLFAVLLPMMLVSGCAATVPGDIKALDQRVTPLAKVHATALADCTVKECDEVVLTGQAFITAYNAGVGKPK